MFYVYMITNKVNNKRYIGKTNNLKERWKSHKYGAKEYYDDKSIIQKAILKYGVDNFEFKEIDSDISETDIMNKETFWIGFYKTNIKRHGDEFGYNLTDGGEGISGYNHTQDSKNKISNLFKGKPKSEAHKQALSEAKIGSNLSDSHKENISKGLTGKILSEETKEKLRIIRTGSGNSQAILNEEQVREIKKLLSEGKKNSIIAKMFNVGAKLISDIKNNKTWKHI